jgi:hypothetical protein
MPRFAVQSWKSHNDLKAIEGSLDLWFTIEITGPPSGTYPVFVDFVDPSGNASRVPETFNMPFSTGRWLLDVKATIDNVKPGNYALRLTIGGEQLDVPFSVGGGPAIKLMVLKAKVVDTGELLATVLTQDSMYGDTGFLSFDLAGPEPLPELEIARRFADLYAEHDEGRSLRDCQRGDPFPDVACVDTASGMSVTLELTQLAYEGWQTTQSHAKKLKRVVSSLLVSHRPKYRDRAMILYFNRDNVGPLTPNPQSKHGKAFLAELDDALNRGLWAVHDTPPDDSGKSLRTETLHAIPALSQYHRYLRKVELGPNISTDPRLTSPDDPLVLLNSERVVVEGEFSRLVKQAVNRKLKKGTAYTADILLIHHAVDPHVLVAAEDDDVIDLARRSVADTKVLERFNEVWLFDIWENSIFKLNNAA